MRIVDRHIGRSVGMGFIAVAALLLPLFGFLDLIAELDDVGQGSYRLWQALEVTAMTLPRRAVELCPFIALLGGIAGLGQLSAHGELTALRAAGVAMTRIGAPALAAALTLAATLALADQFVVSPLQQKALQWRTQAMSTTQDEMTGGVLWVRDGRQLLRVGELRAGRILVDIELFRFGDDDQLQEYVHAERAEIHHGGEWQLHNVLVKRWASAKQTTAMLPELRWQSIVPAKRLEDLTLPAASLSPLQLYRYNQDLRRMGQSATVYAVALWQKLGAPILTAAMILLAVPFTVSRGRDVALGGRLALGAMAGLAVYLINQIVGAAAVLLQLSPPLAGILPATVLLLAAVALVRRLDRG